MPVIPFIPLIAAGVGVAGGALRRGGASSPSSGTSSTGLEGQQQAIIDIQKRLADYGIPAAQANYAKAGTAYDTSLDFYNKLLTGSNEDILKFINADEYTKSADAAEATAYNLGGRSGSRAAALAGVGESRAANLNRIITSLRASAPAEIGNLGQAIANMAGTQLSAATGGLSSASNAIFGLSQLKQQEADRRADLVGSIIGAGGTILGAVLSR